MTNQTLTLKIISALGMSFTEQKSMCHSKLENVMLQTIPQTKMEQSEYITQNRDLIKMQNQEKVHFYQELMLRVLED